MGLSLFLRRGRDSPTGCGATFTSRKWFRFAEEIEGRLPPGALLPFVLAEPAQRDFQRPAMALTLRR